MLEDLKAIVNLGIGGVAIYFLYKLDSNHLTHIQKSMEEMRDSMKELASYFKDFLKK